MQNFQYFKNPYINSTKHNLTPTAICKTKNWISLTQKLIANDMENLSFQIECKFVFTKLKIPLKIFTTATISSLVKKGKRKTVPQEVNSQINYHNVKQTELKNNLKHKKRRKFEPHQHWTNPQILTKTDHLVKNPSHWNH